MKGSFNLKRTIITALIIIFTSVSIGAAVWITKENLIKKENESRDKQIAELESQIELLKKSDSEKDPVNNSEKKEENDGWLSYKNTKYGFEFSYPKTHYFEERSQDIYNVILFNNKYKGTRMGAPANSVYVHPKKSSDLEAWINSEFGSTITPGSLKSYSLNSLSGYYFKSEGMGGTTHSYVFENQSKTFAFVIHSVESQDTIPHAEFINKFKIN